MTSVTASLKGFPDALKSILITKIESIVRSRSGDVREALESKVNEFAVRNTVASSFAYDHLRSILDGEIRGRVSQVWDEIRSVLETTGQPLTPQLADQLKALLRTVCSEVVEDLAACGESR